MQDYNFPQLRLRHFIVDTFFISAFLTLFAAQQSFSLLACYFLSFFYLLIQKDAISINKKLLTFYLVVAVFFIPAILSINHGYTPIIYFIMYPLLFLFAKTYSKKNIFSITFSLKYSFWILSILICIGIYLNSDKPDPLEGLIPGTSTNGITSYLIVLYIAYSIASLSAFGHLPIYAGFLNLIISIFGLGRGSILVAGLLLIFVLSFQFYCLRVKNLYKLLLLTAFILLCAAYVISYWNQLMTIGEDIISASKFAGGLYDEARAIMISEYAAKIDILHFFLGADYWGTSIINRFDGNPHNSFIRAHAFFGFWGLVMIFLPLLIILGKKVNWQYKFVVLFLIFSALLRAITEPIFFPSMLDFFYFLYFFLFYYHYNSSKKLKH